MSWKFWKKTFKFYNFFNLSALKVTKLFALFQLFLHKLFWDNQSISLSPLPFKSHKECKWNVNNKFNLLIIVKNTFLRWELFQFDIRHRRMKSSLSFLKTIELPQSTRMAVKLTALTVLLLLCYSNVSSYFYVDSVSIPENCANSCPPQRDPSRFICARNRGTGQLGMFDGECFFGRFNHCIHVRSAQSELNLAIFFETL